MADQRFDGFGNWGGRKSIHIGSDGAGGLWFADSGWRNVGAGAEQKPYNVLERFDGKQWRQAWNPEGLADATASHAAPVIACENGRAVVVQNASSKSAYLLRATGDGFDKVSLGAWDGDALRPFVRNAVLDGDGGLWFTGIRSGATPTTHLLHDALQEVREAGAPLLCDREGGVWFISRRGDAVRAKIGEQWVEASIAGLRGAAAMAQSSDGRLWLLHGEGVSQLAIDPAGKAVVEVRRLRWGSPKNDFRAVFIDEANGLWFVGRGNSLTRFALPPSK
jgi:hypothetical protein